MAYQHTPVLLQEVLNGLQPQPNQHFADGTVGGGGHAAALLAATSPGGHLLAFDRDADALQAAQKNLQRFAGRVTFIHDSYSKLAEHAARCHITNLAGVLLDLGFSSTQLHDQERGFSFQVTGPLDMRYDVRQPDTAAHLLNTVEEQELGRILKDLGDEPQAARLARAIVAARRQQPFRTTDDLLAIVQQVKGGGRRSLNPATQVWQALRIAVNHELEELTLGLAAARDILALNGRLAVITFHSGEDRIVKEFIRHESRDCLCPPEAPLCSCNHHATFRILGRPVVPKPEEIVNNPRARSARLRLAQKISQS